MQGKKYIEQQVSTLINNPDFQSSRQKCFYFLTKGGNRFQVEFVIV